MAERIVVVDSLSKEHRMIGRRVGWVAGPADTRPTQAGRVYKAPVPVATSRFAATPVLRGDHGHVAELERGTMLSGPPRLAVRNPGSSHTIPQGPT